jgi:hypothetical protein
VSGGYHIKGVCEICRRSRSVGWAISAFDGVRHLTCNECLMKPAETLALFEAQLKLKTPDPALKNWYTWMDGKYVHWTTFVHLRKIS